MAPELEPDKERLYARCPVCQGISHRTSTKSMLVHCLRTAHPCGRACLRPNCLVCQHSRGLRPSCNRAGVTGGGQRECDRRFANRSPKAQRRQIRQRRMEPLRSPVVATGGNPSQIGPPRNPQTYAKTVAGGCDLLPESFMVRRGSTVRVRQRASSFSLLERCFCCRS